jgi:hypothetical protein
MGEKSVNSSTSGPRADFLQKTLEEAYQAYPWRFARTTATLAISNGIATLPTTLDIQHPLYAKYLSGTDYIELSEVDESDSDKLQAGDNAMWLTAQSDGTYLLNTLDAITQVVVQHQTKAPTLDSADTVGTPYPSARTLSLGARRYVKLGQNPDADIAQDQSLFEKALAADIAAEQVPAPRKNRRTRAGQISSFTGEF